jgi:cytochrome c biogenesis protein CcmG/thiol:disulfide interchange protein DsbE
VSRRSFVVAVSVLSAALVALLVYGVVGAGSDTSLDQAVKRGDRPQAPLRDLPRPLLDGSGQRSLKDLEGRPVLLNFWASWCDPCRSEVPLLKDAQRRLKTKGGEVLGATFEDAPTDSQAFERELRISWPSVRDVGSRLADEFGNTGLPETFLLDGQGRVVDLWRGELTRPVLDRMLGKVGA